MTKKLLALMGLSLALLVMVGCGGDDDKDPVEEEKKKCETEKRDTHVWNKDTKKCEAKPAENLKEAACKQLKHYVWENDKCREATQEECTDASVEWNEQSKRCLLKVEVAATGDYKYSITLRRQFNTDHAFDAIQLEIPGRQIKRSLFKLNDCIKLQESQFAELMVYGSKSGQKIETFCDSTQVSAPPGVPGTAPTSINCAVGNYFIQIDSSATNATRLEKQESANENIADCGALTEVLD